MMGGMTCQMNFWLVRRGPCLRLCAAIPSFDGSSGCDAKPPIVTYDSPGTFFSRLDATIFEPEKVEQIKRTVIHAIGTLDQVVTIAAIDLNPAQLGTLDLKEQTIH
jgi:hypothetical protein